MKLKLPFVISLIALFLSPNDVNALSCDPGPSTVELLYPLGIVGIALIGAFLLVFFIALLVVNKRQGEPFQFSKQVKQSLEGGVLFGASLVGSYGLFIGLFNLIAEEFLNNFHLLGLGSILFWLIIIGICWYLRNVEYFKPKIFIFCNVAIFSLASILLVRTVQAQSVPINNDLVMEDLKGCAGRGNEYEVILIFLSIISYITLALLAHRIKSKRQKKIY